jgi:hypothetical protein
VTLPEKPRNRRRKTIAKVMGKNVQERMGGFKRWITSKRFIVSQARICGNKYVQ